MDVLGGFDVRRQKGLTWFLLLILMTFVVLHTQSTDSSLLSMLKKEISTSNPRVSRTQSEPTVTTSHQLLTVLTAQRDCEGPPQPQPRTKVTYSGWKHGDEAVYTCKFTTDVYIKGTTIVYCQDREWETPTILCAPTTCWYEHKTWGPVYKGTQQKTTNGFYCNAWTSDSPHYKAPKYHNDSFYTVDGSKMAAGSYCRLFNDDHPHAWCYTTDNNTRWDNCDVPYCDMYYDCEGPPQPLWRTHVTYSGWKHGDEAVYTCKLTSDVYIKGTTIVYCQDGEWETPTILCAPTTCWYEHWRWGPVYKGTQQKTTNGFYCNAWTSDSPHDKATKYHNDSFYTVDGSKMAAGSYCRLFNDDHPHAWCYTTDNNTRWDNCDVPYCDMYYDCEGPPQPLWRTHVTYSGWKHGDEAVYTCKLTSDVYIKGTTIVYCQDGEWETPTILCAPTTCWYEHWRWGPVYKGTQQKTMNGFYCNAWTSDSPHDKATKYHNDSFYTVDGSKMAAGSYCRLFNDDHPHAWCYTTDNNTRWDNCDVPQCDMYYDCDGPPLPYLRTRVTYNKWKHGDVAIYTCKYESDVLVKGKHTVYCDDGTWETPTVLCAPTTCWYNHWRWGPVYKGTLNKTKKGFDCNAWTRDSPHNKENKYNNNSIYTVDGSKAAAASYCRIFDDGHPHAWCYTTNTQIQRDDCDVPRCDDDRGRKDNSTF